MGRHTSLRATHGLARLFPKPIAQTRTPRPIALDPTNDISSVELKTSAAPIKIVTTNPRIQSFISLQSSVSSKEQHYLPPHNPSSLCNPWPLRKNSNYFHLRIFPLLELFAILDLFACLLVGRHPCISPNG